VNAAHPEPQEVRQTMSCASVIRMKERGWENNPNAASFLKGLTSAEGANSPNLVGPYKDKINMAYEMWDMKRTRLHWHWHGFHPSIPVGSKLMSINGTCSAGGSFDPSLPLAFLETRCHVSQKLFHVASVASCGGRREKHIEL